MNSELEKDKKKEMNGNFLEEENNRKSDMMIEEFLTDNENPEAITDNDPQTTPENLNDSEPDMSFFEENEQFDMTDYEYLAEFAENLYSDKSDDCDDENMDEDQIDEEKKPETFVDKVRNTEIGKMVLGEDGKFDNHHIERIAESAKSVVKGAADILKNLLGE